MKRKLLKSIALIITMCIIFVSHSQNLVEAEATVDCTCPGNLIQNPSFENVSTGSNLANWTTTVGSATRVSGTLVPNCANLKVCGTYIGAIGNPSGSYTGSGNSTTYQDVTLIAGAAYNFSVYAGRTDAACTPTIKLIFYNNSTAISGETKTINVTKNAYTDCALANYTLTGNAPASTTKVRIELKTTCGYLKIDAMCFTVCKYAGSDGSTTLCDNSGATVNLNTLISGENTGGTWTKIDGTGSLSSNGIFTPAVGGGASVVHCKYTVTGFANGVAGGNCTDESNVTITINKQPNAGANGNYDVCDSDLTPIDLFSKLTGNPDTGGSWSQTGTGGNLSGGIFTPVAGSATYNFVYTVPGTAPCGNSTATVTVNVYPNSISVNAGPDGEVCAHVANEELADGDKGLTTAKKYQLAGQMTGASSVMWSDNGAGGVFNDPTLLNALYTPPIGATTVTLTLTSNDPNGPCGPATDDMVLTEIACAGILDPCTCNQVTYNPSEIMEVKDFIEIDGTPGQVWTILVNGGGTNAANGGQPYGTMQQLDPAGLVTTNIDFPVGTPIPEVSPGLYRLDFAHDSGKGYTVTVTNGTQTLSISNYCIITTFAPNFSIGATICNNAAPINLAETITDGTPADAPGAVDYYYINSLGAEVPITTAFNPADYPVGSVVQIFGRYTPNNVIDCEIIKQATNQITVTNCALPLDLISFSGKTNNEAIVLNWKTANEKDFTHYEVQKSANALEYASIGSVFANKGNYYNFIDNAPNAQNNYYRLKMVNSDGSFNFSQAINVDFEKGKSFVNIENPSKNGEFIISTGLKNPTFTVLNSSGTKVQVTTISNGVNKYVVKPLQATAGLYFLNIESDGKIVVKKVIVP